MKDKNFVADGVQPQPTGSGRGNPTLANKAEWNASDLPNKVNRLANLQMSLSSPRRAFMEAFVRSYGPGGGTLLASDIKHVLAALEACNR